MESVSHFDEKSGVVVSKLEDWGRWWQTLREIHVEIEVPEGTRAKQLKVKILPKSLEVALLQRIYLEGSLFGVIHSDESTWTLEENKLLRIVMQKANYSSTGVFVWESLLSDQFPLETDVLKKTKEKLDLERFKIEQPAYDFSKFKQVEGFKTS